MVAIADGVLLKKKGTIKALQTDRLPWWNHWRELADLYLPRRYVFLMSPSERRSATKNSKILDSTGTLAARTLASGMMNGITSPSRQWFKLRLAGFGEEEPQEMRIWLDQVERDLQLIMAESNFYNSIAVLYLDLVLFGSAAQLIYEDQESVIRCFNPALGEFYLGQSDRLQVNTFAREFTYKVNQVVDRWGIENVSAKVADAYNQAGSRLQEEITIVHLIEPNDTKDGLLPSKFPYREYYWEAAGDADKVLSIRGFNELPGIFPRWDTVANESYGGCPAMDALGDVIQLQHETKAKGQALDKLINPPVQADIQLQHKPTALLPRGITYVSGLANSNAAIRPVYQINPPLGEMSADIVQLQGRIREIFHNDLFRMIAQLETVRTATEIDARREEKLVLLGPVLERFENEALDPAINRIFNIANRAGLLPAVPEGFEDAEIDIQYVSVLSTAQRAVGTASTERFLQLIGSLAAVHPPALNIPNFETLLRDYGRDIGVAARGLNTPEQIAELMAAQQAQAEAQQQVETAGELASGAETLSKTDVGGGLNALELIAGGG